MLLRLLSLCAAAPIVLATNLFVASYAGNITTLSLTEHNGTYTLATVAENNGCAPNPSWLTQDPSRRTLYCLDEGLDVLNGTLSSFTIARNGSLSLVEKQETIKGPVSGAIYGGYTATGGRAIALAHYDGSALSSWSLSSSQPGDFNFSQAIHFNLSSPGPNLDRQASSHAHEAILDPSGDFIVMPDLGADLVRVFSIDPETLLLTAETPLQTLPGSGPRHAAFWNPYGVFSPNGTTYMFLVSELANNVTSYRVSYPSTGGMAFEQVWQSGTYGPDLVVPAGNAAAEITVSPDNRFLIISNRNNTSFQLPPPPGSNSSSASIPSDSLATFELHDDGSLALTQLWPAGGDFPRHFSLNKVGDLVAVGLQTDQRVVVMQRDVQTGAIGRPVAEVMVPGNVTYVGWDD